MSQPSFEVSSGNGPQDLGLPNAEEHPMKARLAALLVIERLVENAQIGRLGQRTDFKRTPCPHRNLRYHREWRCRMMIEIQRSDLQTLIRERMSRNGFRNAEEVLVQAFDLEPLTGKEREHQRLTGTGADLIAAMQASPFKEELLESPSERSPVRESLFHESSF